MKVKGTAVFEQKESRPATIKVSKSVVQTTTGDGTTEAPAVVVSINRMHIFLESKEVAALIDGLTTLQSECWNK